MLFFQVPDIDIYHLFLSNIQTVCPLKVFWLLLKKIFIGKTSHKNGWSWSTDIPVGFPSGDAGLPNNVPKYGC